MKKWKICFIIFLILILGIESYFVFFKKNDNKDKSSVNNNLVTYEEINKENEKYLVDVTTPYKVNGLKYKKIEDGNVIYFAIEGLKDKILEEKINNTIKEKIYKIKEEKNNSKYKYYAKLMGSFENVLSVSFSCEGVGSEYVIYDVAIEDTLNIDLNTGNEISIDDVVIDKSILRTALISAANESIIKEIGFVCSGGPCDNPGADYGKVEDGVFSLVQKYNLGDYLFTISETGIQFYFDNVRVPYAVEYYEGDEGYEKCNVYDVDLGDGESYKRYICQDNYLSYYEVSVDFIDITDIILIYDRFKTEESIFTSKLEENNRKFVSNNEYHSFTGTIDVTDNQLIDFDIDIFYYLDEKDNTPLIVKELKNKVVKESGELKKDRFNIYNINGALDGINDDKYYYVYFEVTHYDVDKEKYLKYKKQIYLDKFNKMTRRNMDNDLSYNSEYKYLKEDMTKKALYFYIIDENGKEYNSRDILNSKYDLKSHIPEEWLKLGKYKTKEELIKNVFVTTTEKASFPDRLVIYDDGMKIKLKYKGNEVTLTQSYYEHEMMKKDLYK